MKNFLKLFGVRVTIAIATAFCGIVLFSAILIYQLTARSLITSTRHQIESIAQTTALMIDAQKLMEIPLQKEGINAPAYGLISDQLKKVKAANSQIKYIYILRKTDQSNIWHFVVDPDAGHVSGKDSYPGASYNAGRFKEMLKAFDAPSADKKIEVDEWGKTLSGYAPIRDGVGRPVAIVGADISAENIYAIYYNVRNRTLQILAVGLILALIMGFLISSRVVKPVNELIAGTRYISDGHLNYQVQVKGNDEIKELADAFNKMAQNLDASRNKLMSYFYDTVKSLVLILEIRDQYTLGHSESVAHYSEQIARRMGYDNHSIGMFRKVVLLHDIGKVGIRDNVLHKPDRLNDEEWEAIKQHPVSGELILKPLLDDPNMLKIIRNHHERYDGKGYPDGLNHEQIPMLVAIVTVADSYDAMTSNRSYRRAMSQEQAIEQLLKGRGSQFHPDVVDVFLEILQSEQKKL